MNKKQLIDFISMRTDLPREDSKMALEAVLEAVIVTLKNKETLSIVGFGAFSVAERPARKARNPRTGEEISIAATTLPRFKAGKTLREAINSK